MKRVLVLNQFALPRDQGGGTRHADLFSRVPGWTARIVAGNRNHYTQQVFTTSDPQFHLVDVPSQDGGAKQRLVSWLAYCQAALRFGLKARPDVVYASTPHLLAPLAGWALARVTGAAYVLEVRDLWPESFVAAGLLRAGSPTHRALSALERFIVRRADEIVVVTHGWEDHFRQLGADMDCYTVVPNGTEPYDLDLTPAARAALRAELGITGTTAIFAGAHGPKDGIDLILDAAAACPEINFLLIGDGPEKAPARARIQREGLTNVEMRPPIPKDQLPRLLAACDIGIHSVSPLPVFRLGMSPNKLFDYLAAGLPVASNAGQAIATFLVDDQVGCLGGPSDLPDTLLTISSASAATHQRWSNEGRRLVASQFSRSHAALSLKKTLDSANNNKWRYQPTKGRPTCHS